MLVVFFTAKTHKPDAPFRAIVWKANTWQHIISQWLQLHLSALTFHDPFSVPYSDALVKLLKGCDLEHATAFSIYVQDMYHSLLWNMLIQCINSCITHENDEQLFINKCLVSVESYSRKCYPFIWIPRLSAGTKMFFYRNQEGALDPALR